MLYSVLDVALYIVPLIIIPMSVRSAKIALQLARGYEEAGELINAKFEYGWMTIMTVIAAVTLILAIIKFGTFALIILSSIN